MTVHSPLRSPSPLDRPPSRFAHRPFYAETLTLLRGVRDNDFTTLNWLCDDEFGIVDVDPEGASRVVRNRVDWERWLHERFVTLDERHASTDFEILSYKATRDADLGYSVVEFRQFVTGGEHVATFDCIATIIWKRTDRGWREARRHATVMSAELSAEFQLSAPPAA